jgi:hypothetical protein
MILPPSPFRLTSSRTTLVRFHCAGTDAHGSFEYPLGAPYVSDSTRASKANGHPAGNTTHPNFFSRDIFDLLYSKTGAHPFIRVGGTSTYVCLLVQFPRIPFSLTPYSAVRDQVGHLNLQPCFLFCGSISFNWTADSAGIATTVTGFGTMLLKRLTRTTGTTSHP